jgi:outer membrane protein TolC
MRERVAVTLLALFCAVSAPAQEAPLVEPTPDLTRVRLLDEVPNYAAVLADQWRSGARLDDVEIGRSGRNYGRLVEIGEVRNITLQGSIALALHNNTGLKVQRLDPIFSAAEVRRVRSIFDPEFYGDASKTYQTDAPNTLSVLTTGETGGETSVPVPPVLFNSGVSFDAGLRKTLLTGGRISLDWTNSRRSANPTAVFQVVPEYTSALGLTLNQPLLRDFGWRQALLLVDVAEINQEAAFYRYRTGIANLVTDVERNYWLLVLAIEDVRVEEQGLEAARELLRQNEGRYNVGALPRTAVLEAQAEVAQREAQLIRAGNLLQNQRDNLRALINYGQEDTSALLMIAPADKPTALAYDIDLERSLDFAAHQRPELIAARLDVESSQTLRKVAENQLLPRLDLVASAGLRGRGGDDSGFLSGQPTPGPTPPTGPFGGFAPNEQILGGYDRSLELLTDGRFYQYVIGATIQIPIANADAKARYAQAKIDTERSWLNLHQLEENVTLEVKKAVSNLESDMKRIEATRVARELAEENLRNQQARYDVGLATTKDILDFQDQLTQRRRAEVEALTGYNTSLAEMRRVEGTLLDARNIIVDKPGVESAPWWARF